MDLSPRSVDVVEPLKPRRKWGAILVLALVLGGGGLIVARFLGSAIDYYCNVDEVGIKSGCETNRTFRIQGTVEQGTVVAVGGVTTFTIGFNGKTIPVRYEGDPGGLFQECIPVVVHGKVANGVFQGDQLIVKHSNEYDAANKDRLDQAKSEPCSKPA